MLSFAIYRKPYETGITLVKQSFGTDTHIQYAESDGNIPGFVVAPFNADDNTPIVFIKGDAITQFDDISDFLKTDIYTLDKYSDLNSGVSTDDDSSYADYLRDFDTYHASLIKGNFSKLVLARRKKETRSDNTSPLRLFAEACKKYPRLFIALHSTPVSGTWLVASPELLLDNRDGICHTMSLAGTMKYEGISTPQWSDKNIREQALVTEYINEVVQSYADTSAVYGPATVRAGNLMHLRTDFTFTMREGAKFGEIVDRLSPTPAVCGIPKDKAKKFIIANEHAPRSYYSGYSGPVRIEEKTSLYVSLRCMRIFTDSFFLYAGGGLLPDSDVQSEWHETESKMQTMLSIIKQPISR